MATKIMRLTRHDASPAQRADLLRIFGDDAEIIKVNATLPDDPHEAVDYFDSLIDEHEADVVEVVLPIRLLSAIFEYSQFQAVGGRIINAVTDRELLPSGRPVFTFNHYIELVHVEANIEEL